MSKELFWLIATVTVTGRVWLLYILDRMIFRGLMGTLATLVQITSRNPLGRSA
jgi:hypothetical protein